MKEALSGLGAAAGRIIGGILGLGVGLLLVVFGFWRGLFVLLCVFIGFLLGQYLDGDETINEFLQRLLPLR